MQSMEHNSRRIEKVKEAQKVQLQHPTSQRWFKAALIQIHLSNVPSKAANDGLNIKAPVMWVTWMECRVLGFGLAQSWTLYASEQCTSGWKINLYANYDF